MAGTSASVALRTVAASCTASAMLTMTGPRNLRPSPPLLQVPQEVLDRTVEQLGALPLHEVSRTRHDEGPDQLAEGDFAHLGEAAPDHVVLGSVQRDRGHRAHLEE